jgi:hypothetical protein
MIAAIDLSVITPDQTRTIAIVLVMVSAFAAAILYPVTRAWARRLEGKTRQGPSTLEFDDLRTRVIDLQNQVARIQELEDRVDFAERLLAQQGDPARLPAGGES